MVGGQIHPVPVLVALVDIEQDAGGNRGRSPAVLMDPTPDADPRGRLVPAFGTDLISASGWIDPHHHLSATVIRSGFGPVDAAPIGLQSAP